jgi:hypothetical protein
MIFSYQDLLMGYFKDLKNGQPTPKYQEAIQIT